MCGIRRVSNHASHFFNMWHGILVLTLKHRFHIVVIAVKDAITSWRYFIGIDLVSSLVAILFASH